MPTYAYKAKNGPGRTVEGRFTADNQSAALARLDAMGYIPIEVQEQTAATAEQPPTASGIKVAARDLSTFTRQLASMLRTGIPILRALLTIRDQTESPRMREVVADLEANIRDGRMLSESMARYPRVFSELYVNMVRSGESAGVLDEILLRLAEAQDEEEELRTKVQSAMAYPLLVMTVGVVTIVVMLTFFMPRILEIFAHSPQVLPLPTRILIGVSRIVSVTWYWVLLLLVLGTWIGRRWARMAKARLAIDRGLLRLPVAGRLLRDADLARFAKTLALLIKTGIPIHRAIDLGAGTMRNSVLREEISRVSRGTVQQGASLAAGLRRLTHVPIFVANMAAVGEESGRLEEALDEVGRFYGRELEREVKLVTALLEPVLILVVGAMVGFIIFATLLPIFQIGLTIR